MKGIQRVLIGLFVVVLSACGGGGGGGYPDDVVRNFVTSCAAQGATVDTCECVIDKLQKTMSLDEFKDFESAIVQGSSDVPQEVQDAVQACI